MQSPSKMVMKKRNGLRKSKNKISNNESQSSLHHENKINLRDNSVPPNIPKVKELISREPRHKTTIKKRSIPNFNTSIRQD